MTILITWADLSVEPDLVLGYTRERASRNNVHAILDDPAPVVTLRPAALASGTLRLFFSAKSEALAAEDAHTLATVLEFSDSDNPEMDMRYVLNGTLRLVQDDEMPELWTVEVPFQEVTA